MEKLGIGIIGTGRIGRLHAENIHHHIPELVLEAVCDPQVDKSWANSLVSSVYEDIDDLLENNNIDAVLICSPSELHADHCMRAAKANKHIFCEKPVGLNESEIIETIKLLNHRALVAQVGFNRRFDPSFEALHKTCRQHLHQAHVIKITSRDPEPPPREYIKQSGGLFMDMSIHDFDMARFLSGAEVCEVMAIAAVNINPVFAELEDYDTAIIQLKFDNGALGVIDNSRRAVYGYDQRIEVYNHQGTLMASNVAEHHLHHHHRLSSSTAKPKYFFLERYQEAFIRQLQAFYKAIVEGGKPAVEIFDGLQALRIAKAAGQSAKENKPIQIDNDVK